MGTIPNQSPVGKKNCPYSYLVTRVCGTDLRYIYACALGVLYKNLAFMMTTKFHVLVV